MHAHMYEGGTDFLKCEFKNEGIIMSYLITHIYKIKLLVHHINFFTLVIYKNLTVELF